MQARLRRYVIGHAQIGQVRAGFTGTGWELFKIFLVIFVAIILWIAAIAGVTYTAMLDTPNGRGDASIVSSPLFWGTYIVGLLLFYLLIGIWGTRALLRYQINNTYLQEDGRQYFASTAITYGQCAKAFLLMPFLQVLTLGLATAWTWTAQQRIVIGSLRLDENFPLDTLVQVNPEYESALGEDLASVLDVDFGL